jgi:hypothetical protein
MRSLQSRDKPSRQTATQSIHGGSKESLAPRDKHKSPRTDDMEI